MRFASTLGCLLVAILALSRAPVLADEQNLGLAVPWRWSKFTTKDGLPRDAVTVLLETADGGIWVGTGAGLARYDGWRFHAVALPGGRKGMWVTSLASDSDGDVWVIADGNLYRGGTSGFRSVSMPEADLVPSAVARLPSGGTVLLASRSEESGHLLLDMSRDPPHPIPPPPGGLGGSRCRIFGAPGGSIWLHNSEGVHHLVGDRWETVFDLTADSLQPSEITWIGNASENVIACFQIPNALRGIWAWMPGEAPRRVAGQEKAFFAAAAMTPDGDLVAVLETGEVLVRQGGEWSNIPMPPEGLKGARCLWFGANGDLWSGTRHGLNLCRRSSRRWTAWVDRYAPHEDRRIHEIDVAADGTVWIASAGGLSARGPDGALSDRSPSERDRVKDITGLAVAPDGVIWTGSGGSWPGVRCWDGVRWRSITEDAAGGSLGLIHRIRRDSRGRLWLLSLASSLENRLARDGTVHVVKGGRVTPWEQAKGIEGRRIYDMSEGPDGALWFATSEGVSCWSGGLWRHWNGEALPRLPMMFTIAATADGGAWTGHSESGLYRIKPDGNVRRVCEREGIISDGVWEVAIDGSGRVWVGTVAGVGCLSEGNWCRFGSPQGLDEPRVWPVTPHRDRIYMGTVGGGVRILDLGEARLPPPRVSVHEAAPHLRWTPISHRGAMAPESVETRHRLDGGSWSAWSLTHELHVGGLASGDHVIEVQAKGLFGGVGPAEAASFSLPEPLHERGIFLVPVGLLSLALVALGLVTLSRTRRAARVLAASERRYRSLMEEASDAILITGDDGRIAEVNRRCLALFGLEASEVVGTALDVFFEDSEGGEAGDAGLEEHHVRRPDGSVVPVEMSTTRLADGRVLAIVRDLGDRLRLEAARLAFERKLAETQRLESLEVLAGGVAHDYNNLLTAIVGHAELALDRLPADARAAANIRQISFAAERATDLTSQLLAYTGRRSLEPTVWQLNRLLGEMVALLESTVGERAQLEYDMGSDLPYVDIDAGGIRQVVLSLIVNASEAIGETPGRISVTTGSAPHDDSFFSGFGNDEGLAEGTWVWFSVRDSGPGMDDRTRSRVFEPFFTTKFTGRGLGLAAVKGIVEGHRGHIRIETAPGRGATFTVALPATEKRPPLPPSPVPESALPGSGKILLVDDEESVREFAAAILADLGFETIPAARGDEGLEAFERHEGAFICAVIDLTMPGLGGVELLERIREARPGIPAVLMSGWSEMASIERVRREGRTEFLPKPFTGAQMEAALAAVLGRP